MKILIPNIDLIIIYLTLLYLFNLTFLLFKLSLLLFCFDSFNYFTHFYIFMRYIIMKYKYFMILMDV